MQVVWLVASLLPWAADNTNSTLAASLADCTDIIQLITASPA